MSHIPAKRETNDGASRSHCPHDSSRSLVFETRVARPYNGDAAPRPKGETPRLDDTLRESTPELLVERCNDGEKAAWDEFYARYYGLVSRMVKRYARGRFDETDDMVQEVFIHIFKALRQYDPTRPIETYLLEIARRVRISQYRSLSAQKRGGAGFCHGSHRRGRPQG